MIINKLCFQLIKTFLLIIFFNKIQIMKASGFSSKVYCNKEFIYMQVSFPETNKVGNSFNVYMQNLAKASEKSCQPLRNFNDIIFVIHLENFYECGFTRVLNKIKTQETFYQNLIVEEKNRLINSTITVKCSYKIDYVHRKHKLIKRDVLPLDFMEDDDAEIIDTLQQEAPEPQVLMEVRQNGQLVDGMVTVIPGTPLTMEIKLNNEASSIYGLNVNSLEVSDTRDMSETIIFRGCTVDPYLFENFNVSEGHKLMSKFRAFKFPNTAFVQFRANVQICLQKCLAPQCTNGQPEQSRKRREVANKDNNKHLYEVSLNLLLNIDQTSQGNKDVMFNLQKHLELLKMKNLILKKLY